MSIVACPANAVGAKRIGRVGTVARADVLVVVEGCLLVVACPEVEVAQQHIDGEVEELGVRTTDFPIVRRFYIGIGSDVVDEILADFLDAILRVVHFRLCLAQDGLGDEGNGTVVEDQLQVGPCTECLHGSILTLEDQLVAVVAQCRVALGKIVVAVVDDGIIVAWSIIHVLIADIKEGHIAKIGRSELGNIREVATHLAQQNRSVGDDLHLIHDACH